MNDERTGQNLNTDTDENTISDLSQTINAEGRSSISDVTQITPDSLAATMS